MTNEEDIANQQELLVRYRITLHHYLKQRAMLGEAYMPPSVTHGIRDAETNIARIKRVLRDWNVEVDDHPSDEGNLTVLPDKKPFKSLNSRALRLLDLTKDKPAINESFFSFDDEEGIEGDNDEK